MSQTISPERTWRRITSNSAVWSRNLAFSARTRNRMLSLVNQAFKKEAWKKDTDQLSGRVRRGGLATAAVRQPSLRSVCTLASLELRQTRFALTVSGRLRHA